MTETTIRLIPAERTLLDGRTGPLWAARPELDLCGLPLCLSPDSVACRRHHGC